MRCTFYVDGDLLEPWEEELVPGPPRVGSIVARHGLAWVVRRVELSPTPDHPPGHEASIWVTLPPER